jgi:hypothetical protein
MFIRIKQFPLMLIASGIMISGLISCGEESSTQTEVATSGEEKKVSAEVGIRNTLKTEYFDVTVDDVKTRKSVKIDEFQDLKEEAGNKYLIIDVTLKNTDKESRMMFDGMVIIKADGQEYKYEEAETILADGWGLIMDNVNPLVTKKTKLVYKIPEELKGTAYYNPARSDADQVINLGAIQ